MQTPSRPDFPRRLARPRGRSRNNEPKAARSGSAGSIFRCGRGYFDKPPLWRGSALGAAGVFTERSMILRSNLPKLREFGGRSARVLDAGGWYRPVKLPTHFIDLNPYDSRRIDDALDPERRAFYCRYLDRAGRVQFTL